MTQNEQKASGELAIRVADSIGNDLRVPLQEWLKAMIDISQSKDSAFIKARRAIQATIHAKVIWPVLKVMAKSLKEIGWNKRSPKMKWVIAGATAGLVVFPGAGAGIAALGGAIGVPLWIVLGAGSAFAHTLYSELAYRIIRDRDI